MPTVWLRLTPAGGARILTADLDPDASGSKSEPPGDGGMMVFGNGAPGVKGGVSRSNPTLSRGGGVNGRLNLSVSVHLLRMRYVLSELRTHSLHGRKMFVPMLASPGVCGWRSPKSRYRSSACSGLTLILTGHEAVKVRHVGHLQRSPRSSPGYGY